MKSRQKKNVSMNHLTVSTRVTRSMSLKNGRENSLPIPIDIIIMIFSRLNSKSIARCRCVSKLWASILRRSDFPELFLSMSCSRGPKLLFAFIKESKLFFSSPHPQNPDKKLSRVVINHQMKFPFDYDSDCESSDLVNGLIYLRDLQILNGKEETILKICNPSTGQTLILPKMNMGGYRAWSLFGYDPIDKQFKVLAMTQPGRQDVECEKHQVLTIGIGNLSWRMVECCIPHNRPRKMICINGVLYYTSIDWYKKTCKIVCFDIRFEKFSFIKVTGTLYRAVLDETIELINYSGKLGVIQCYGEDHTRYVFFDGTSIKFKLWVLEDFEKHEWSKHTFVFPNVPKNMDEIDNFVGVTQKNEILLSSSYKEYPFYLFYLNLEKKTIVRVKIQGMEGSRSGIYQIFLDHVEDVKLYGNV